MYYELQISIFFSITDIDLVFFFLRFLHEIFHLNVLKWKRKEVQHIADE
jgi:hypothetical protein